MIRQNPSGDLPLTAESAYVDKTAIICGKVVIGENVFVGPYAVIRADDVDDSGDMPPITTLVAKTSHRVADLFAIPDRGYLREGYWADLMLIKPEPGGVAVSTQPILSQCGWTPFARCSFRHSVRTTIVSGQLAWRDKRLNDNCQGLPLRFMR